MDTPRKERFPKKKKSKLIPRSVGPFEILERIDPNSYKVDLLGEYGISSPFNVVDLSPYYTETEELRSLRANSFQEKGLMEIKAPRASLTLRR